jgi:hypothetical protein
VKTFLEKKFTENSNWSWRSTRTFFEGRNDFAIFRV